jgi:hypothetical protein
MFALKDLQTGSLFLQFAVARVFVGHGESDEPLSVRRSLFFFNRYFYFLYPFFSAKFSRLPCLYFQLYYEKQCVI